MKTSNINLAVTKNSTKSLKMKRRLFLLRTIAIGFLFVVVTAAIILFILIASSPLPNLQKQENGLTFQMTALHGKMSKHLLIGTQLKEIGTLVKNRSDVATILQKIQSVMPATLTINAVDITKKKISLTVSSDQLDDIDAFTTALLPFTQNKTFSDIGIVSLLVDVKKQSYLLTLAITPT